jgi:hypothetical protein
MRLQYAEIYGFFNVGTQDEPVKVQLPQCAPNSPPFTTLVGKNSVGKSSIIKCFLMFANYHPLFKANAKHEMLSCTNRWDGSKPASMKVTFKLSDEESKQLHRWRIFGVLFRTKQLIDAELESNPTDSAVRSTLSQLADESGAWWSVLARTLELMLSPFQYCRYELRTLPRAPDRATFAEPQWLSVCNDDDAPDIPLPSSNRGFTPESSIEIKEILWHMMSTVGRGVLSSSIASSAFAVRLRASSPSLDTYGKHDSRDPLTLLGTADKPAAAWKWSCTSCDYLNTNLPRSTESDLRLHNQELKAGQTYVFRAEVTSTSSATACALVQVTVFPVGERRANPDLVVSRISQIQHKLQKSEIFQRDAEQHFADCYHPYPIAERGKEQKG